MSYQLLSTVNSPDALKLVPKKDIPALCAEIREFLIENVGRSGGHLASNLGVVELTVAMHRVFDSPTDHIIFDVGHQAYVHKILTGRRRKFDTLRIPGGLSGFTVRREGPHDPFGAGHSSTSLSAALGFAEADAICGSKAYSVCLLGDGAYTGGMVHEALNNCKKDLRMVVILNENRMSISQNKGAFASYLARVRTSKGYMSWKRGTNSVLKKIPLIGSPILALLSFVKRKIKRIVYSNNFFEDLGLYYIGPVDGNDYAAVERALAEAKRIGKTTIVHVYTKKGKGYDPAEQSPDEFHSVASAQTLETYHSVFADELCALAESDEKIVAVTAAMGIGTGLDKFGESYPKRYFDVGIAEAHALTFSAGIAASGLKPYAAIYSTFLQRGYDSILHDIALQGLPVRIMIDRAGLSVGDGATHHGIFDVAFLSHIPGIEIISAATLGSLRSAVAYSASVDSPIAIRYPNKGESELICKAFYPQGDFENYGVRADYESCPKCVFVTYGSIAEKVLQAEAMLKDSGYSAGSVLVEKLKPFGDTVRKIAELTKDASAVIFVEEGIKSGGFAMNAVNILRESYPIVGADLRICAIDDDFACPKEICDLYDHVGLSPEKLYAAALELIKRGSPSK